MASALPRSDGPLRFAILLSPVGVYGRERLLLGVARRLLELGHTVDILLPAPREVLGDGLPEGARFVCLDRWWMRVPGRRRRSKHRTYLSTPLVAGYLRKTRPDALLSGSIPPNLAALLARRMAGSATRVVLRQSNVIRIAGDARYGQVQRQLRDPVVRTLYRGADRVIAVSHGVADNVVAATGLPAARVCTVQAGVAEAVPTLARETPDHPWLAPGEPPVVLNVGRLVAQKDHATLLRAFARVRERREVRLIVLGPDGPARAELDALIAELGLSDCVDLAGFNANPYAFMARAGVFVLSSTFEGMPNALLEALACGCPVVSTDCPSGPREILDDGAYGRLVPMRDPAALAEAIEATLDERSDREALRARAAAFGVDRAVAGYVEALLEAAGAGRRPRD
ncbi:glycosyltransferase [Ferruginivarius sediminum]|uniref:Glycosyltransferase n=1 Tax=Ferruginivarius sediminum TaxID=2661937 RepID=A0A369TA83_9PROT|nr:glycosyltransferase [Ferruginivarius sediminum]RDD62241.1 glycosyltransferase [Ferruginivarius sediminum]